MNYFRKIPFAHCLILFSIIFLSCSTGHHLRNDIIYKEADFTPAKLKDNGLIICGISSEVVDLSREERAKYSSVLSNVLLEKLKNVHTIRVINTLQLIDKMGSENYFNMMGILDHKPLLKKETMFFMRDSIPDAKYVLFAHIENENVIDDSYEEYIENEEGKERIETEYHKTYLLSIDFKLYDLLLERMVWNDKIYNEVERNETRTTRTGCFESCVDNFIKDILFGEPAEIGRDEVLTKIVERMAFDLSGKKK